MVHNDELQCFKHEQMCSIMRAQCRQKQYTGVMLTPLTSPGKGAGECGEETVQVCSHLFYTVSNTVGRFFDQQVLEYSFKL